MYLNNKKYLFSIALISTLISFLFLLLFYQITNSDLIIGQTNPVSEGNYVVCCGYKSSGYPYFTIFLSKFSNSFLLARFVQLFLFAFGTIILSFEFYRLTKNKLISLLLFASIILNIKLAKLCFDIYADALYIPILILIFAFSIRAMNQFSLKNLFLISLLCGILISIKLSGFTIFIFLVILFAYFIKKTNNKIILATIIFLPFFVMVFTESFLYSLNESKRPRALGLVLFGKLPVISQNIPAESKYEEINNVIYNKGLIIQEMISRQENFSTKQYLKFISVSKYQHGFDQDLDKLFKKNLSNRNVYNKSKLFERIVIENIKVNKVEFIKLTLQNYFGFWSIPEVLTENNYKKLKLFADSKYLSDISTSVDLNLKQNLKITKNHTLLAPIVKLIVLFAVSMSIVLFLFSFYKIILCTTHKIDKYQNVYLVGVMIPIYLHIYYFSISIITIPYTRYILTAWPLLMISANLFIFIIYSKIKNNIDSK